MFFIKILLYLFTSLCNLKKKVVHIVNRSIDSKQQTLATGRSLLLATIVSDLVRRATP